MNTVIGQRENKRSKWNQDNCLVIPATVGVFVSKSFYAKSSLPHYNSYEYNKSEYQSLTFQLILKNDHVLKVYDMNLARVYSFVRLSIEL